MPANVSSRITWVEGSHPWHSVLIFPMKIFHVLFYSSLCYLVIINRVKKPLALCCLVDIALPWTCLLCSFQGSLFQFTVSEWLYWVFFSQFCYSSTFGFAAFCQSVAVLCSSCLSCLVFSLCFAAAVGREAAALLGRVRCRGTHKQAVAAAQKMQKGGEIGIK